MYHLLIVPLGATLPPELNVPVAPDGDLIIRLLSATEVETLFPIDVRELQCLIEFRDVIPLHIRALIGLPDAEYGSVWSTYAASLDRVTIENIAFEQQKKANVRSDTGQREPDEPVHRASLFKRDRPTDDVGEDDPDDEKTGTIE